MSELRVPTIATVAQVTCADGRVFAGRVFVPAAAFRHSGPMRPEEWVNDPAAFFPFLPDREDAPVLLSKGEVVAISLAPPGPDDEPVTGEGTVHDLTVECRAARFEGELRIAMPEGQRRVLDALNRPERFLTLHAGKRQHLVHKRHITRVLEKKVP
ncbi:MAG TPA: hypothetical protein VMT87_00300 [Vicinamibacteria bacterium]|nr:hypothetical protein [Vicinamibacteria bacterium]